MQISLVALIYKKPFVLLVISVLDQDVHKVTFLLSQEAHTRVVLPENEGKT